MTSGSLFRGRGVSKPRCFAICLSSTVRKPRMTVYDSLYYKVPLGLFLSLKSPIEDFTQRPSLTVIRTSIGRTRMREKEIEKALVTEAIERGGLAVKLVTPSLDGMPDRLVLMPDGHAGFVEVKAPGLKPRALQLSRHRMLEAMGFMVFVLDDKSQIGGILDAIQTA